MSDTPAAGITSSSINATPVPPQRPPVEAALNDVHNSIDALEVVANALYDKLGSVFADEPPVPGAEPATPSPMRGSSAVYHRAAHASNRLNELQSFMMKMIERVES